MLNETNSPNWVPTLNMGHNILSTKTPVNSERHERISEKTRRRIAIEELIKELLVVVSKHLEEVINEEVKITAIKELEIGREYIKVAAVGDMAQQVHSMNAQAN